MAVRAAFIGARVASLFASLLLYLFARLFQPGAYFGTSRPGGAEPIDLVTATVLGVFVALATFLLLFAAWTYRAQRHLAAWRFSRLLAAGAVIGAIAGASLIVGVLSALLPPVARAALLAGPLLALAGLALALFVRGPSLRRHPARARA